MFFFVFIVPSASPTDLRVSDVTSTSIELMWGEVPLSSRNGIIISYEIQYNQTKFDEVPSVETVRVMPAALTTVLTGLQEYVNYSINISASTSVGAGPFSPLITVETLEDSKFRCTSDRSLI